jgi:hypothetical protein
MSGSEHRSRQFERALAPGDDAAHDDRYWPEAGHGGSYKAVGRRDVCATQKRAIEGHGFSPCGDASKSLRISRFS